MREATISASTTETATLAEPGLEAGARALEANPPGQTSRSPAEDRLPGEWLNRLADRAAALTDGS